MFLASISVVASAFLNLSPTVVLTNEDVLTRLAEVRGLNIKLELVGLAWCLTGTG